MTNEIQLMTLVFPVRDNHVLLGKKKRGFGHAKWNGFGGKVLKGETIDETALRELKEEAGIIVSKDSLELVATFDFIYSHGIHRVSIFLIDTWRGEPSETEEMEPRWFKADELPFEDMWNDDPLWLPRVLNGEHLKGTFTFENDDETVKEYSFV